MPTHNPGRIHGLEAHGSISLLLLLVAGLLVGWIIQVVKAVMN